MVRDDLWYLAGWIYRDQTHWSYGMEHLSLVTLLLMYLNRLTMIRFFVWNFKDTLLNYHTLKYIDIYMYILYTDTTLRALRFKSTYAFLKRPPDLIHRANEELRHVFGSIWAKRPWYNSTTSHYITCNIYVLHLLINLSCIPSYGYHRTWPAFMPGNWC